MALRKPLFLNTGGDPQEVSQTADSIQIQALELDTGKSLDGTGFSWKVAGQATLGSDPAATLVTKSYVDGAVAGFRFKQPARVVATTNQAITGLFAIDGVTIIAGDRVLLTGQSAPIQNGLWVAAAGAWARPTDFANGSNAGGDAVTIQEGTLNADTMWLCTTNAPTDVVGTDPLSFAKLPTPNSLLAGDGIEIIANTISVDLAATDPGLEFSSGDLRVLVDPAGAILRGSTGLAISLEVSNPTLDIGANELGVKFSASTSGFEATASGLSIHTEATDASLEVNGSGELKVRYSSTLSGLEQIASGLAINTEAATPTLEVNGSGELKVRFDANAGLEALAGGLAVNLQAGGGLQFISGEIAVDTAVIASLPSFTAAGGGVTQGDVVFISAANTIAPFATLSSAQVPVGIALQTAAAAASSRVATCGFTAAGYTGLTAGTRYYWSGSAPSATQTAVSGEKVILMGTARSATELHADVKVLKVVS